MKFFTLSAFTFVILLFWGCKDSITLSTSQIGKVDLTLSNVPSDAIQAIARLTRSSYDDRVLTLTITDTGNASGSFFDVAAGTWHLKVDVVDDADQVIYTSQTNVEVQPSLSTKIALTNWGSACVSTPSGLIAWWPGDGNTDDITGGTSGILNDDVSYTSAHVSKGFKFDGINGRVHIPDAEKFELTGSMTIEMWIKIFSFPLYQGNILFFRGDDRGGGLDPYALGLSTNGKVGFGIYSLDSSFGISAPIELNKFIHVAAILDSSNGSMRIYLNGILVADTTTTIRPFGDLDPLYNPGIGIGNTQGYYFNYPFHGIIDEVSLYNRALSPSEIQGIYLSSRSGKCK